MKKTLFIIIALSFFGCGLPKNLKVAENKDSSVIGISLRTVTLSIFNNKPETVYFVKLDEKDENNLGNRIIPSNYVRGDYAYLINAQPGKYAAVASFFTQTDNCYNSFYDADAIKSTVIDVGPNQIVFIGKIKIENRMKNLYQNIEQNGDKAQLHYYNLLKTFMYGTFYCGSLISAEKNKDLERDFLVKTRAYFKDSEWLPLLDKSIEAIDK
ncbi:MAG TPA: hypothetical protein PLM53_00145 [Spirochaetota bacterium]|nr:hypothetical protein [Spirochaetota bacterium]HPC43076.1 hypothetical protein [Spirochaetota bacterium]HPL15287.1 hypothetical protein [Spirochaetota bacterium]HQF06905.1 hypothetical protein [Spirochaetota bacterium]HQH95476.1 hypothetical protein [Spirochaetota bacterium]